MWELESTYTLLHTQTHRKGQKSFLTSRSYLNNLVTVETGVVVYKQ